MRFAFVDGERREAQPGLSGVCPGCDGQVLSRCGEIKIWHWAHRGGCNCDPWWEKETEWHRNWKNQFPDDQQEIVHHAPDGERHIADVKTVDGWVIEFQHSNIKPEERRSRESFYGSLIWVVDGTRRKRDRAHFLQSEGEQPYPMSDMRRIVPGKSALLRDWRGSRAHVFFDFGDERTIWWLWPGNDGQRAYVQHVSRDQFIRIHRESHSHGPSAFDSLVQNFSAKISSYESPPPTPPPAPQKPWGHSPQPIYKPLNRRRFRL